MQPPKEEDPLLYTVPSRHSYSLKGASTPSIGGVFSPNGESKGYNGAGSNTSTPFKGQTSTPGSLSRSRDSYIGSMTPDSSRKKFYKGTNNMSTTAFQTMAEAMARQREAANSIVRSRSRSATVDSQNGEATMSEQEKHIVEQEGRKALYGSLPMVSAFGMQNREASMRQVITAASFSALESLVSSTHTAEDEKARLLDDVDVDELIVTLPLMLAVLVAVTLQFTLGFNTAVMNSPAVVVFPGHSTGEWALAVSAFAVGGPFGALIGGQLADERGRRGAILITTWIFFVGGVLMTLAPSMWWLVPARLVVGFASGLASVVVPVYLGEVAPPTLRGTLGTLTQFAMVIGILVSGLLGVPLATESRWRYLFAVTPLLCLAQIAVSPFLLESPRWLLGADEDSTEARVVIKKLRGFRSDGDVEVQHFLFAASQHRINSRIDNHSSTAVWHLIQQRHLRQLAVSAIVLQVTQQLSGINAVFYYSTSFFEGVIDSPLVGTNLVALVNVLATYAALRLMDTTGRRTLLLWSIGGMLVSTACIIGALTKFLPNSAALLAVMSFVGFFEIGLGPVPWLIVAEMFDAKYVATAMSVACVVNWLCNFAVGIGFPYLQLYLGAFSFLPFAVVLTLAFAFVWLELPETHGRTVEELHTLMQTAYALKDLEEVHIAQGVPTYVDRGGNGSDGYQ